MLLAKRDFTLRLANAMAKPQIHPYVICLSDSVCPSSVVCDVRAPYSGGLTFREYFCTVCCGHCIHQLGLRTPTKVIPMKLRSSQCVFALPHSHYNLYKYSFVMRNLFDQAY